MHDDATASLALEAQLTTLGYQVAATAASGAEAVAVAAGTAVDLVLVDMAVGGPIHGVAAAEEIRRHQPMAVVLMGTEREEASLAASGVAEPYGFLSPPFASRELRTTLELARCRHDASLAVRELEVFFSISTDLFCFLDFSGHFRHLNPAWERTLGFSRAELMSRPFIEFVHPDDRERTLRQNARVRGGGRATGFENRYLCRDGSHRWLLWNAAAVSVQRVIYSVARDITARKQAEMERTDLVQRLETSLAEVSALQDILPICSYCRKIRDDEDFWHSVEHYISRHTRTRFSHGICPDCMATEVDPQFADQPRE